jgi:hypothetical protein
MFISLDQPQPLRHNSPDTGCIETTKATMIASCDGGLGKVTSASCRILFLSSEGASDFSGSKKYFDEPANMRIDANWRFTTKTDESD